MRGIIRTTVAWTLAVTVFLSAAGPALAQTISEMERRAQEYYDNKEFTRAINEWMRILELDPENDRVQRRVEYAYEEKQRKDFAFWMSRKHLRLARKTLLKNFRVGKSNARVAVNNFVIAYRIDPRDPPVQVLREEIRRLDDDIRLAEAQQKLSEELKRRYAQILEMAEQAMDARQYELALKHWNDILEFFADDPVALEGKRRAELAISNRIRYEQIMGLINSGKEMMKNEKYSEAKLEFEAVLRIDPKNRQARNLIEELDDRLENRKNFELRRLQAEKFYVSGIANLNAKNFSQAEDDLENVLALIDNYKDTKERLASIKRLKAEYAEQLKRLRLRQVDEKFQSGLVKLSASRYRDAVADFEEVIRMDPGNKLARDYIKTAQEALKQLEEEVVDENSPYYSIVNSLVVSGKLLYDKADFAESKKSWEKILTLFPKNRIAIEYKLRCDLRLNPKSYERFSSEIVDEGRQLLRAKNFQLALNKFQLIRSLSPDYPDIDRLIRQAEDGLAEKKQVAGATPGEIESRYQLGLDLYRRGGRDNFVKALEQFRWIVARDPNNSRALISVNRIESQLRIGTTEDQRPESRLTDKQMQMVRYHYFRGINFYSNNNLNRAIEEWRKVLAIDPANAKARNNIQRALALMKK
ncbi:MAG TPA: hypothetical protein PLE73_10700 [Spirochaetota bacterium]|nr:hypothetical protein [Spirochaetota bacterium]HOS40411.1 hypothetical protein [Spirochaetota bacterium]HPI23658.1 hypothetical protein [Spirochaetota bacterium]HPU88778.1 hypothetical protein [Spirochaetota bacterium]